MSNGAVDTLQNKAQFTDSFPAKATALANKATDTLQNKAQYTNTIHEFLAERTKRPGGFDMRDAHYHPYYELYYLITGRCRIFITYNIYSLCAGDIVFLPPSCLHRVTYEQGQAAERFTVSFTPEFVRAFCENCADGALDNLFSRQKQTLPPAERGTVENLFTAMIRESLQHDCYTKIQQKSLLFQLLTLLGRCRAFSAGQPLRLPCQEDAAIQQAAQFIYEHHREPLSLEQAAEAGHLSPTYFSKRFRQITGMRFKEYLTHVRLQDAVELLRTTSAPITEIALTCGFSDGNYFGDAFKKALHMSPSQFRKKRTDFFED